MEFSRVLFRSALLVRGLPGLDVSAQRQYPLVDRPCAVVAARPLALRIQDAPPGAGLGDDGDQGPVQEVSNADHAQAAISVPDDQSDPDGERPLRLLGAWRLDPAARCRACLRLAETTSELPSLNRNSY